MKKNYILDDRDDYSIKKFNKNPKSGSSKRKDKPENEFIELLNINKLRMAEKFERDKKYRVKKER